MLRALAMAARKTALDRLFRPLGRPSEASRTTGGDRDALEAIWHVVSTIPRGRVSTYGAVARAAGWLCIAGRAKAVEPAVASSCRCRWPDRFPERLARAPRAGEALASRRRDRPSWARCTDGTGGSGRSVMDTGRARGSARLRGIAYMIGAVFVFAIMDALLKGLSARYGALQVGCLRCISSLLCLSPVLLWRRSWRGVRVTRP